MNINLGIAVILVSLLSLYLYSCHDNCIHIQTTQTTIMNQIPKT